MCGTLRTGTHGFPDPQVSAFPQTWQRLSILASGGEGEVYVLWVIPHRQLHFGPDILRTLHAHWALKKKKDVRNLTIVKDSIGHLMLWTKLILIDGPCA